MFICKKNWNYRTAGRKRSFWHEFNHPVEIGRITAVRLIKYELQKEGRHVKICIK